MRHNEPIVRSNTPFHKFIGVGPAKELEHLKIPVVADLKVGYNLHDHVSFEGLHFVYNTTHDPVYYHHSHDDYLNYLKDGSGPLTANGLELIAFLKTKLSKDKSKYPDIQLLMKREQYIPGNISLYSIVVVLKSFKF